MEITNRHVENIIGDYLDRYAQSNHAARIVIDALDRVGIGLRPLLDHLSIRTIDIRERALEFEALGFAFDDRLGVIEHDSWWAKVYRKPGFPAIYLDQAFQDHRGAESVIPQWVRKFTDGQLHHLGICADTLENAVDRFAAMGVRFAGEIIGEVGSEFRQIYTEPEIVDGMEFTTFEILERRWGYSGFISPSPKAV